MKTLLYALAFTVAACWCSCTKQHTTVRIHTDLGDIVVKLYDSTPLHRDNFLKLAKEGTLNGTLFHRVIPEFMIQGGDPTSKNAVPGQMLGGGHPGYGLPAEINALHIRGALAAARTNNPEKTSNGSQFYIVVGEPISDSDLDEAVARHGRPYSEVQRQLYKELGGYPWLDYEYTVFGEVLEGMDVADKIVALPVDGNKRPVQDVQMTVTVE